ncbi:hypothetical protein [Undibacter mobilis]|uniref:Uncharacterized protein n=1 Tax=Undibacter mobilis TaxID=2292256 RepID=A0A371B6L5_9BRAD|nr:hypothetical protein [Undibacter mobilis]RDV03218.1 hypothetical protein DXH78_00590 [Undibacter mobilis]
MNRLVAIGVVSAGLLMTPVAGFFQLATAQEDKRYLNEMESRLRSFESATPPAVQAPSRWNTNGSIVQLVAERANRRLIYEIPRADLLAAGVGKGTLLFKGKKEAARYSGTAYAFAAKCATRPYAVTGDISADEKQVTLRGRQPRLGATCKVTGYSDEEIVLTFIPPGPN